MIKNAILAILLLMSVFGNTSAQADESDFQDGCTVRENPSDKQPSYEIEEPAECDVDDKQLDGGNGPNSGLVQGK